MIHNIGAADVFLGTGRNDYHLFSPEERQRAVDLYSATPPATAQVVRHLGYPTRQCLERWLAKDPRYAGHMAKPIIPLGTRTKAIELVPGGMRRKQAARRLGADVGAVHNWVKAHREGSMAALQPRNRNASQADKPAPRRRNRRAHGRFRSQRGARRRDARQDHGDAAEGGEAPGAFRPRVPLPVARMAGSHGTVRADAVDGREGLFAGQRGRGGGSSAG